MVLIWWMIPAAIKAIGAMGAKAGIAGAAAKGGAVAGAANAAGGGGLMATAPAAVPIAAKGVAPAVGSQVGQGVVGGTSPTAVPPAAPMKPPPSILERARGGMDRFQEMQGRLNPQYNEMREERPPPLQMGGPQVSQRPRSLDAEWLARIRQMQGRGRGGGVRWA
jgi:hypothetical protein